MHGHPFVFLMNATSRTHACQPEIWIPFHVPECCVDFIDICGASGHLAVGVWCRFSQRLLGIAHIVWARSWKLNDGFITTSSESLRLRIASQPHFNPWVCKLGVIEIEGKNILGVKKKQQQQKHPVLTAKSKSFLTPRGTWDLKHASKISAWRVPMLPKGGCGEESQGPNWNRLPNFTSCP